MPGTHGWLKELELKRARKKRGHINGMKTQVSYYMSKQVYVKIKTLKTHAIYQLHKEASCKVQN